MKKSVGSKEREKARENTRRREKGKMGKGWWWSQKGKGKGKGLRSMSEWDGWDHIDECSSVPILSMSCGVKHPEIESPDLKITSEEGQVLMKRVKSMCIKNQGRQ